MGKASKWFRALLGLKRSDPNPSPAQKPPAKKRWSFAKAHKERDHQKSQHTVAPSGFDDDVDASRHAIAVAAATAAVAEAAVAAAQAAAAVVKLTRSTGGNTSTAGSGGGSNSAACVSQNGAGYGSREERAAVTIQSHFRAYLVKARRALRALKALVKLQALAKGYIYRKQFSEYLQQMQAVARAQARARAGRVLNSEASHSSTKSSSFNHNSPATLEKFEHIAKSTKHQHLMTLKRNGSKSNGNLIYDPGNSHSIRSHWMGRRTSDRSWEQGSFTRIVPMDDERSDKILEVDPGKPHNEAPKYRNMFHSSHLSDQYCQSFSTPNNSGHHHQTRVLTSPSSREVQSWGPLKFARDHVEESNYFCTADNSPLYYSASSMGGSSRRDPLTPTKSDCPKSYVSGYLDHPSYMAYTESSKAKVRSVSAPKQRPQYERSSSTNQYSVHGFGNNDSRLNNAQKVSALHASFASKAYPGSGRLDRLGMPIIDVSGFSGGRWQRC